MERDLIKEMVKFEELIEYQDNNTQVGKVTWIIDFGSWKKGQYCDFISFDFDLGCILEHNLMEDSY